MTAHADVVLGVGVIACVFLGSPLGLAPLVAVGWALRGEKTVVWESAP